EQAPVGAGTGEWKTRFESRGSSGFQRCAPNRRVAEEMDATLPIVTREEIAEGLRRLGVAGGQEVLLHSSLKSFGRVDGGPDAVIDAFLDVLGPSGTLVCPTLTFNGFEATRPVFDSRTLPSET